MLEMIIDTLREWGIIGLLLGIGVEALSIPFPAAIVFLLYGYIINPAGWELVWISLLSAAVYTAVAYIPYVLSVRYHYLVSNRIKTGRAQRMVRFMERYREWTIAGGRVLGMGYIVYVAAFCKISPIKYGLFTFIGVLPVALAMLYLGGLGNVGEVYYVFQNLQYVITAVIVAGICYYIYYRYKLKNRREQRGALKETDSYFRK